MAYAKLNAGGNEVVKFPYTRKNLIEDNPNVSFPEYLSTELLGQYNVVEVVEQTKPTVDDVRKCARPILPPQLIGGDWTLTWEIDDLTEIEYSELVRETKKAVNAWRDYELSWADVEVLKYLERGDDVPQELLQFKDDLRNLSDQSGYPFEVTRPNRPTL